MIRWRALVPIKAAPDRKTRLAGHLSASERTQLSDAMLWHVLRVLAQADEIADITLLSTRAIEGWNGPRIADSARGLNAELQAGAEMLGGPLVIIHADLPILTIEDIAALTQAGLDGVAIAPDRHHRGTNALALAHPAGFVFAFGKDSLAHHRRQRTATTIIDRPGLALDIDVAEDLAMLAGDPASRWEGKPSCLEKKS